MGATCIITDGSAQFVNAGLLNNQALRMIPHRIDYLSGSPESHANLKVSDFPKFISSKFLPTIETASRDFLHDLLAENLSLFDDIFVILLSKEISPLFDTAESVVNSLHGHARVRLIDSMNTSLGLGLIVEYAFELMRAKVPADEMEKSIRLMLPHVYTLLCTPNLSYLQAAGMLDMGQATVGEMLSLSPLFLIEEGKLNPLQKVKNQHSAVEYFIEFIDEFEELKRVAVLQPVPPGIPEARMLHQHLEENFPGTPYSEHPISPFLASMIGPRGFGMAVMEKL